MELDLAGILKKLKNNDRDAWEKFYNSNVNGIYRYVMSRCNNDKAPVEDITQQVFLAAVDKINFFSGADEKLPSWLFGIARIEVLRHFQHNKVFVHSTDNLDELPSENAEANIYAEIEEESIVDQVLNNLSDGHSEVLVYKYCDQLSVKEISTKTGCSNKAIESLLTRAREAFKKYYKQMQQEGR
jgi:RNA polymerase sigma-70 factor, ECF subfamily